VAIALRELRANRLTFRCREAGDEGEPVILLHGFPETSRTWEPLLARLEAEGFRALAPDQRGYSPGARPRGAQHYGWGTLASDVTALADAAGFGRFHLVGHGHGAGIAWTAAQRAPERVASLCAVSLPHFLALAPEPEGERALAANDFAALRAMLAAHSPDEADEVLGVLRQPGALPAALHWQRRNAPTEADDPLSKLGEVATPTLLLYGRRDALVPRAAIDAAAGRVTGACRVVELDATHWPVQEASACVCDAVVAHLRSSLATRSSE
jgi:pimeloyl-ACP methyl ester carboxylesterase